MNATRAPGFSREPLKQRSSLLPTEAVREPAPATSPESSPDNYRWATVPTPPAGDVVDWAAWGRAWRDWGLSLASPTSPTSPTSVGWVAPAWLQAADGAASRRLSLHAYREAVPGPRWKALFDATWPAYRRWWLRDGESARPSLGDCEEALRQHMPELVPTWLRLRALCADDPIAARLLSMWGLPAFAVGCAQIVVPGSDPVLVRNYDYDAALFEGVIASTDYSGARKVLGTSDLLWGLLDGMNSDGLAVSLTYGGRQGSGEGFGIPLVLRYLLETCATVDEAAARLRRLPVSQSYNVALVDSRGGHVTVFVAPGQPAETSALQATTNHRLDRVERPEHARRFDSVGRQQALLALLGPEPGRESGPVKRGEPGSADSQRLVAAMQRPPLRNDDFDRGFGTLYTVEYRPARGLATWHWADGSWTRGFGDGDEQREVALPDNRSLH